MYSECTSLGVKNSITGIERFEGSRRLRLQNFQTISTWRW
jgi:hypothetical protein